MPKNYRTSYYEADSILINTKLKSSKLELLIDSKFKFI